MKKPGAIPLCSFLLLWWAVAAPPLASKTIYPMTGLTGGAERIAELVPGELIVKFHPRWGRKLHVIRGADARLQVTNSDPLFADMAELNRALNVKGLRRLVKKHDTIRGDTTAESFLQALRRFPSRGARSPARHQSKLPQLEDLYVLRFPADVDVWEAARLYAILPEVEYAEPNIVFRPQLAPDDPFYHSWGSWDQRYADLWGLQKIEAEGAWDRTTGSAEIVIAVTDTGLDLDHEDMAANVWSNPDEIPGNGTDDDGNGYVDDVVGWDFVNGDNDPTDDVGHGSHVAGTIAAVGNNGVGVVGVTWNCRIMPVKGLGAEGGTTEWLVNALIYAADNGADVINCSWGGYNSGPAGRALHEAVQYAYNLGCVIVAAAGNSTDSVMEYAPAAFGEVVTVAATNQRDQWCDFSNWGFKIDVSAPGGDSGFLRDDGSIDFSKSNILSLQAGDIDIYQELNYPGYRRGQCILGQHYYRLLGTSMAAPNVSGLVALILSIHPEFTVEEIRRVLWAGADDVEDQGWDIFSGHGRISARASLSVQDPSLLPVAEITSPAQEETVTSPTVKITGTAASSGFQYYTLSWGHGELPLEWTEICRSSTPVTNGTLCEWDPTGHVQGYGILRLDVYSSDTKPFSVFRHCRIANHLLEGWPQRTLNVWSRPAIADLDRDGQMEVIIAGSNSLYVYHPDGSVADGWPRSYGLYSKEASSGVALSDLDGDEDLEIVVSTEGHFSYAGTGKVFVWHHDGTAVRGWPKTIEPTRSHPAIGDLDVDGQNDIVVPASTGKVYAWRSSGELLDGWPVMRSETSVTYAAQPGPALADVDGDGDLEVFVGSSQMDGTLYAWHHDGRPLDGWPVKVSRSGMFRSPVAGDLDRDGSLEILSTLDLISTDYNYVYIWEGNGEPFPGWPKRVPGGTLEVSLADLDGDGDVEILASTDVYPDSESALGISGSVQAWHHDGTAVAGWPVRTPGVPAYDTPLVADVDGDDELEVIAGTAESLAAPRQGKLYIWHADGSPLEGWPFFTGWNVTKAPALGDVDGDGDIDMVATAYLSASTDTYVFDLRGEYDPFKVEWGTYRGDLGLKGLYVDSTTIPRAVLEVSPLELYFLGEEEGPNPPPQTLSISNVGADILRWHASTNAEWLGIAPSEGIAPSSPRISADLSGLGYGSYHAEITVRGDLGTQNSPQVVSVSMDVVSSVPLLSVTPSQLEFHGIHGQATPPAQQISITNLGMGSLEWSAEASQSWISISPTGGTAPGEVNVSVDLAGLPTGDHSGKIIVTGRGDVRDSPQEVDVFLSIREVNHPPDRPQVPSGPRQGKVGAEYRYSTSTTDPDGDWVRYVLNWGDGLLETEFVDSGAVVSESHSWKEAGSYEIRVKAIDQRGAESPWSAPRSVVIRPSTSDLITTEEADAYVYLGTSSTKSTHAQSFIALGSTINRVSVALAKHRSPSANIYLSIRDSLKGGDLFRAIIRPKQVTSADVYNPSWVEIEMDPSLEVVQGETYYLVLTCHGSSTNAYKVSCNRHDPYADGMLFAGIDGYPMSAYDILMKVVFGGGSRHENRAPSTPERIEGPQSGKTGIAYDYSTSTVDPDGDSIRYVFDWGDASTTRSDLVDSGSTVSRSHRWDRAGDYGIRVKAVDEHDAESEWSAPLEVRISEPEAPRTLVIADEVLSSDYLGTSSNKAKISQSFIAIGPSISGVSIALAKYRNPSESLIVAIRSSLSGANLVYSRITPSQIPTSYPQDLSWVDVAFPGPLEVMAGEKYYLVLTTTSYHPGRGFKAGFNDRDPYPDGMVFFGAQDTPLPNYDMTCKIYFAE